MYITQHFFGEHEGHLTHDANDFAKESGAWHVNYTDPCTGLKRGWFVTSTLNGTDSREVEQNVMRKVQAIGGFEALRKTQARDRAGKEKILAIFPLPSEGHDSGGASSAAISQTSCYRRPTGPPSRLNKGPVQHNGFVTGAGSSPALLHVAL